MRQVAGPVSEGTGSTGPSAAGPRVAGPVIVCVWWRPWMTSYAQAGIRGPPGMTRRGWCAWTWGPNPLWLLEDLCGDLDLRAGMRVLDLGSGRGATSVFLAREFGVEVLAVDLWVAPKEATAVFADAGVTGSVRAVQAEAHALPFPAGYFDAIVSVDAFEYFGTADSYLAYIIRSSSPVGSWGSPRPR